MINADSFIVAASQRGFRLYTGVPCSYLKSLINYAIDATDLSYAIAANEGDAVAIASGAELAGIRSVVMLQNSGLGNAVNPLTSLNQTFKIPILAIVTWRGQPEGFPDEPQHQLMGSITPELLELMQISWEYFPQEVDRIEATLDRAVEHMEKYRTPYALLMKKGSVEPYSLKSGLATKKIKSLEYIEYIEDKKGDRQADLFSRQDMLKSIQAAITSKDILLTTTGYTSRELYAIGDRENQMYLVGSMGCVSSLGLGIALARPERRVIVVDGDGAALMRLGALATIGYERPGNLLHILLDNHKYESTGGQSTGSHSINFGAIAAACGYEKVAVAQTPDRLEDLIQSSLNQLTFLYVPVKPGFPSQLPRPKITPPEVSQRLRQFIQM